MALAVKNSTEPSSRLAINRFAVGSLLGALYVLASFAVVFYGLPRAWGLFATPALASIPAIDATLLILVMLGTGAALFYYGKRLLGANPQHGIKAGIVSALLLVFLVMLVSEWTGGILETLFYRGRLLGDSGPVTGIAISAAIGVCLLILGARLFFRPAFERRILAVEDQGWFSLTSYKRTQGQRVRRGTIVSILVLAGCGIYTLLAHRTLETGPDDWGLSVPFTATVTVTDPGDTAALKGSILDKAGEVRIVDPGKQDGTNWRRGTIVSRTDYDAEVARRKKAGVSSMPVAGPVINRYALRDLNDSFAAGYVRVTDPGKSQKFKKGDIVPKLDFQEEKARLEKENLATPNSEPPRLAAGITEYARVPLLPHVRFTLPLVLTIFSLWFAYRLVSFPPFADFLIATEAELNKVSWVTRKRLVQDTIVVLTTMLLMTVFLFFVDLIWYSVLSNRFVGVLRTEAAGVNTTELDNRIQELESEADKEQSPEKQKLILEQIVERKKQRERMKREKPDDRLDW